MAPTVPIEFAGQKESRQYSLSQRMGKSRKYSKGLSFGFIPDYRHAVETIGESEGFGSCGRVNTGVTTLDDSRACKKKRVSMNVDNYDCFGAPLQTFSLSTLSRAERKDLEMRLKLELEQVRLLQKKAFSVSSNCAVSSSGNIQSSNGQHKRAPPENFDRSSNSQARKLGPPGRNGPPTKKSLPGSFESVKPAVSSGTSTSLLLKQCESLLQRLMSHPFGWIFNTPVDVVKLNIPDYFTVIKHPMDLGTVKSKIAAGEYTHPLGFAADIRLTFSNAMTYNPPGNDVHTMAKTLSKYFEVRWKTIEKKIPVTTDEQSLVPLGTVIQKESEEILPVPPLKKTKVPINDPDVQPKSVSQIMSDQEKHKLSLELEALLGELPESIIDFLKEHSSSACQAGEDEIEIDIDALSDDTLFTLRKLLDDFMLEKQKRQKAEPCVMELHNESGFSNSSMPPCKGNDAIDEDIDIVGGHDPPNSSYPPIEIEKDAVLRDSKCGNSSSPSSGSGSSTSDSGSDSLSGSESNAVRDLDCNGASKGILCSVANQDQKQSDIGDSEIGNSVFQNHVDEDNGFGLVEQTTEADTNSIEGNCCHEEGESAPSKRQVSPDRLYRAALLRNRFADTILKAREKALEKGDKRDPEKVRMEREELERQKREEKARLQAEAKAAEDARRKAEAEAVAEAKKKIELEREAARQALLKMEKTVDINENSQFMEDLEMLRAVNDEHIPSFIEESSPEQHSLSGFGSFKLQASSNPLEQLGLYMKVDDEDEDDESEPPKSLPKPANDVEEGEID